MRIKRKNSLAKALTAGLGLLLSVGILTSCSTDAPKADDNKEPESEITLPVVSGEDIASNLEPFYKQKVIWKACEDFYCATVKAPLNWDEPGQGEVNLAIKLRLADESAKGTILFNPGGPGASGIEFMSYIPLIWGNALKKNFNVLAFDPRGVGQSDAVKCLSDEEQDIANAKVYQTTDEGLAALEADAKQTAERCQANTGELLGFVDTQSAAKDMDMLRFLVGDEKLNYLGYSYGTQLGATYAGLFPQKVGKLVLDGAVDLSLTEFEQSLGQAQGFEGALRNYVTACLDTESCPFTGTPDEALKTISDWLTGLVDNPLATDDADRPLTQSLAFYGVAQPLYSQLSWPQLTQAFKQALNENSGQKMLDSADSYFGRNSDGTFKDNSNAAFRAINCMDTRGETDREVMDRQAAEIKKAAPTMGEFFGYGGLICKHWPYDKVEQNFDITAAGAAPIVVIGTTNDPATPFIWAQGLASTLESGVLVTLEGEGHTAYGTSFNTCISHAVEDYFVDGIVPEDGLVCD